MKKTNVNKKKIRCYLFVINILLKIIPLKYILSYMRKKTSEQYKEDIHSCLQIVQMVNEISKASIFSYTCLTRSIVSALICWEKRLKASFSIGVSELPFKSHAWISYGRFPLCENNVSIKKFKEVIKI